MGVAVSTHSALAPISLASTIIGFASFAFTVATAIRVFWQNFQTIAAASAEIPDFLSNIRQSLYEERANLRKARKHQRRRRLSGTREKSQSVGQDAALQSMQSALKHMITNFRQSEKPFLDDNVERRRQKHAWGDDTYGYSSGGQGEDDPSDYYHCENRYRPCGMRERFLWLKRKSNFVALAEGLSRMETRRTGMQVNEMSIWMKDLARHLDGFDDRLDALDRLEHRMSRVVGVRRVE